MLFLRLEKPSPATSPAPKRASVAGSGTDSSVPEVMNRMGSPAKQKTVAHVDSNEVESIAIVPPALVRSEAKCRDKYSVVGRSGKFETDSNPCIPGRCGI